jgi:hypothetical protein
MRSMMLAVLIAFLAGNLPAMAGDSAIGNETPIADQAQDKAETDTADEAKEPAEFKIPAGYQAKKRGKKVVYCRKSMESGTRFSQEKCYDETQLREIEQARTEAKTKFDQTRKICSNLETCGGG